MTRASILTCLLSARSRVAVSQVIVVPALFRRWKRFILAEVTFKLAIIPNLSYVYFSCDPRLTRTLLEFRKISLYDVGWLSCCSSGSMQAFSQ